MAYICTSTSIFRLRSKPQTVWDVVTDNTRTSWRADLDKVICDDDNHWKEITNGGYCTNFTLLEKIPFKRYTFVLQNARMLGRWTGIFRPLSDGGTEATFVEEVEFGSLIFYLICRLSRYLKRMQHRYIADLKRALKEEDATPVLAP